MKAIAMLLASAAAMGALAQKLPTLNPAQAIDVRVKDVQWQPHGDALLYSKEEENGSGIGVFALGQVEGKVLLHLGKEDRWEAQWFEGSANVIVIVYKKHESPNGELTEVSVHLLEAKALREKKLFSRTFDAKDGVEVNVDTSPGLVHAIFRLTSKNEIRHLVLPTSGSTLIFSPDLDRANKEGYSGPVWSSDGTAIYQKGGGVFEKTYTASDNAVRLEMKLNEFVATEKRGEFLLGDLALVGIKFKLMNPPPPVGTPVLELIPFNAALRQVRFRGAWESRDPEVVPLDNRTQINPLQFGTSRGEANSLWLTLAEEKPGRGVLIAPHASRAWISPWDRAVAYLTDGALFVRTIKP